MPNVVIFESNGPGEVVFYAHGSESLRTYLGRSKFHARADCARLLSGRPGKTVAQDTVADISPSMRCKSCAGLSRQSRIRNTGGG